MKTFRFGAWSEAGERNFDLVLNIRLPLFAIQFFGEGIYVGWIPDDFRAKKKESGQLGEEKPWHNPGWFLSMPFRCFKSMLKRLK